LSDRRAGGGNQYRGKKWWGEADIRRPGVEYPPLGACAPSAPDRGRNPVAGPRLSNECRGVRACRHDPGDDRRDL